MEGNMGLRFRKSINLGGGFRINVGKSGIGYSWGTNGYRFTKTANGKTRQTFSAPGSGLSYVEETKKTNLPSQKNLNDSKMLEEYEAFELGGETFDNVGEDPITKKIERSILLNKIGVILLFGAILIAIHAAFAIIPITGIVLLIVARTFACAHLIYSFDPEKEVGYANLLRAWGWLLKSDQIMQVTSEAFRGDRKTNAGASHTVSRHKCSILSSLPFYLKSNVDTIQLKFFDKSRLLLLPDRFLLINGGKAKAINYNDVDVVISPSPFIETNSLPCDAQVIDYTWQYVNKNGTPDKRYKNNRKLPVCLYASIIIKSSKGLRVELQVSSIRNAKRFGDMIGNNPQLKL